MIYEFLKQCGAYGEEKAVKQEEIRNLFQLTARRFDAQVYKERAAGRIIISKTKDGGGYYLPATVEEIEGFVRVQESRIKKHAIAARPAREFMKTHRAKMKESGEAVQSAGR